LNWILERVPLFWLLQLGSWSGYGIVYFAANVPFQTRDNLVMQEVMFACNFAASFVLHSVCRRQWRSGLRFPGSFLVVLAWCAGFSYLAATIGLIARQLYTHWLTSWSRLAQLLENFPAMFTPGFILLSWCALYFGIKYYQAEESERRRALTAEKSVREAELRALRYQIHPHFLFNTLNAISALVLEGKAEVATLMIAQLADFLRATLDGKSTHEVPLREELFLTERYLEIEKLRMGDRLRINVNIDTSISDCLVPHLLLQPLVENAIRHGIAPRRGAGHLVIKAERRNDKIVICVNDDGLGKTFRTEVTGGNDRRVGLANIERRLNELYGNAGRFNLNWPVEGGCCVLVEMPYRPQETISES